MDSLLLRRYTVREDIDAISRVAIRLTLVNEEKREPLSESDVSWEVRVARSRAFALAESCRPTSGVWLLLSGALMVLAAAEGSVEWRLPFKYCGMIVALSYAASLLGNGLDAKVDSRSRLLKPIASGRISARALLLTAPVFAGLGMAFGFASDWRVGAIGLAMLAAMALYHVAWRGSALGVLAFALMGVLMPAGAIQLADEGFPNAHLLWIVPIGALTGAAAFMMYKLPDYEIDDFDGARSILHWLGIDTAISMTWAVLAAALALSAASINLSGGDLAWLLGPLLYFIIAGLFCIWMLMRRVSEIRLRLQRWLIVPPMSLLLICWLGAAAAA